MSRALLKTVISQLETSSVCGRRVGPEGGSEDRESTPVQKFIRIRCTVGASRKRRGSGKSAQDTTRKPSTKARSCTANWQGIKEVWTVEGDDSCSQADPDSDRQIEIVTRAGRHRMRNQRITNKGKSGL